MAELDERRVDELIDEWRDAGTRNPVLSRLRHMTEAEAIAATEGDIRAAEFERQQKHDCHCYPHGFVSTPRAVKEQMKADHIAAGRHESFCPMFDHRRDYEPWNFGLSAPSYTQQQERRDAEAEALDYRRSPGRFDMRE